MQESIRWNNIGTCLLQMNFIRKKRHFWQAKPIHPVSADFYVQFSLTLDLPELGQGNTDTNNSSPPCHGLHIRPFTVLKVWNYINFVGAIFTFVKSNHFWDRFLNVFKWKLKISRNIKGLENEQIILILPLFIFTQITSDGNRFLAFLECNFHHSNFSLISLLNWILHFVNQNKNRFNKLMVK